jgi:hypothetical protein
MARRGQDAQKRLIYASPDALADHMKRDCPALGAAQIIRLRDGDFLAVATNSRFSNPTCDGSFLAKVSNPAATASPGVPLLGWPWRATARR